MNKVAFFTMDVESLYDTSCLRKRNIKSLDGFDCEKEVARYLDFLDENNIKATLFLIVDFLDKIQITLQNAIKNGHEIALHSLTHDVCKNMSEEEFNSRNEEAKKIIKDKLNYDVQGFRFPCFKWEEDKINLLKTNGFKYDSSKHNVKNKSYVKIADCVFEKEGFYEIGLNRGKLCFFNISLSGGAYMRIIPWKVAKRKFTK